MLFPSKKFNKFQFQIGAIKRAWFCGPAREDTDKFQFQIGAIKSVLLVYELQASHQGFNSKLVRLKVIYFEITSKSYCVSIPNWCD